MNAFRGVYLSAKEAHMRFHLLAAIVTVVLACFFQVSFLEWCVLLICIALVIALEIVNSAIEALCDKLHPDKDDAIRKVKDMAAGAVLVASIISAIIGCLIFLPKVLLFHTV